MIHILTLSHKEGIVVDVVVVAVGVLVLVLSVSSYTNYPLYYYLLP